MEHNLQANPLKQYFRSIKLYTKLPSGTSYYPNNIVNFTDQGEIGVLPMTGKDELILKNPDALLNGEAIIEVLSSCVPSVKNPRALLANDIDALIAAVRFATHADTLETHIFCPKCAKENSYKLNLEYALDNMSFLESEYSVPLENGLTVFVSPYFFPDMLKGLHAQFEQNKLVRALDNDNISDEKRTQIFAKAFKDIATIKFDLITSGIKRITNKDSNVDVTDKNFIKDFLYNIDKKSVDKIESLINEITKIGIKKTFNAECAHCHHEWESEIDFNPVNFS